MKGLIWLGCIFVFSSLQTMMSMNGQLMGGLETMVLATIFVFLPAPLLCKQYTKWREKRDEEKDKEACARQTVAEEGEIPALHGEAVEESPLPQETQAEAKSEDEKATKTGEAGSLVADQCTEPPSNVIALDFVSVETENEVGPHKEGGQRSKWVIPFCVLCCILTVAVGVLGYMMVRMQNVASQQKAQIAELTITVDSLQVANSELELQRKKAISRGNIYESEWKKAYAKGSILQEECDFWEAHAVILRGADKTYHRYGCYRIENISSPLILNHKSAKDIGYTPCLDCEPLTILERFEKETGRVLTSKEPYADAPASKGSSIDYEELHRKYGKRR